MVLIPTCNSKFNKTFFHLTSPSKNKKLFLADEFTIIDCHTFYLRNFKKDIEYSVNHYKYYSDFILEHQHEKNLVFVYPDWNWIKNDILTNQLQDYWLQKNIQSKQFLLTNTSFFYNNSHIGIAGKHNWVDTINIQWKHKFGNSSYINNDLNIIYTFDSLNNSKFNEKLLRQTMLSIQALL